MNTPCPWCLTPVTASSDVYGSAVCSGCGIRLRTLALNAMTPPVAAEPWPSDRQDAQADYQALRAGQLQIMLALAEIRSILVAQPGVAEIAEALETRKAEHVARIISPSKPPRRRRRQKNVLLVDDDPASREAAVTALRRAQVPTRTVDDGNNALAAIAAEKPDVLVLELDVAGALGGRDVVNMVKATMEWVDMAIVLYSRLPIASQQEARQIHGADEYVAKGPRSAEALVECVIKLFQRADAADGGPSQVP
jgi:CheY-like chemotaxis protein